MFWAIYFSVIFSILLRSVEQAQMKLNQAYIPLRKAKVNISPENQMICHSIEYLLWWTDERDEGIE